MLYFSEVIQFCNMLINTIVLGIFLITLTFAFDCPTSTWVQYKHVEDDATGMYNIGLEQLQLSFTLDRTIRYQCSFDNVLQFHTSWSAVIHVNEGYKEIQRFKSKIVKTCNAQPCDGNIGLKIKVYGKFRYNRKNWSEWRLVSEYSRLMKDCNQLYWTNWIETTNCETSPNITSKRSCLDCDGDALEQKYCDATGHAVTEKNCDHYWGNWTIGTCVKTSCNRVGERVRTRPCLYCGGLKATNVSLCSKVNESAIMREECINNTISVACLPQTSLGIGYSDKTSLYVGIGVALALIVVLSISLVIVRCRRHNSKHFPSNATANPNPTFSSYEFANSTAKTEEQSDNVSRSSEVNQQNPADAYEFANPTINTNGMFFNDLKQAEQDKQADELVDEPVGYDVARTHDSNACRFEHVSNQDVYVIETPDVLNAHKIAMRADPNVYEIEDPRLHAKPNFPTAQSLKRDLEQNNPYSSLQSSNGAVESTYSRLER